MIELQCLLHQHRAFRRQRAGAQIAEASVGDQGRDWEPALAEQALSACSGPGVTTAMLRATPAEDPLNAEQGFWHVADYYAWDLPLPTEGARHAG
ncbi:hypothetical protein [Streptomyces sp. NPDC059906]|uniref:hypothetical protein n=1 Tax=Streptomyces sp. NPDC059906 TaxID=3346997 RepID=UPI003658656D